MSIADDWNVAAPIMGTPATSPVPVTTTTTTRPLHRVAEVRQKQGVSLRSVARRMGTSIEQVRRQEQANCNMTLGELYRWQEALGVPIGELLVELDGPLSQPVLTRARLLRVMKTARSISDASKDESIGRLCKMLEEQLIELMPELKDVSPWHSVGQRRTQHELGRIAEHPLPDTFFSDFSG